MALLYGYSGRIEFEYEFIDASFFHECFPIPSSRNLCTIFEDLVILGRTIFIQRLDLSDHTKNFEKEQSTVNN